MMKLWAGVLVLVLVALAGCDREPPPESGFAGLAGTGDAAAGDFHQPGPGDTIELPADLGPHPRHRVEWWYLTANLRTDSGKPLGLQWTQFRQGLVPRSPDEPAPDPRHWPLESVWMAHAAVSVDGEHRFAERFARGDVGHAGARAQPFAVWLDHWSLRQPAADASWQLSVDTEHWGYELTLEPRREVVLHGDRGFSAKSASGEGSMYFSYTDLAIRGQVRIGETTHQVSGLGWFDREWSSQFLRSDQEGWDWFALRLDSGARVMAFRLRQDGGSFQAGTWIAPDGQVTALEGDAIDLTPERHRDTERGRVPVSWRLRLAGQGVDVAITAAPGEYWNAGLFSYWESPVTVSGSATGNGYMELTGYGD